jgi:hypothetical protein
LVIITLGGRFQNFYWADSSKKIQSSWDSLLINNCIAGKKDFVLIILVIIANKSLDWLVLNIVSI